MKEPATNKGLDEFLARKEREQRGREFWAALDREVYQMKYQRLLVSQGLPQDERLPLVNVFPDQGKPEKTTEKIILITPTKREIKKAEQLIVAWVQYDRTRCFYCEKSHPNTIDHIIPKSKGGSKNGAYNRVLSCSGCNTLKADYTLEVFKVVVTGMEEGVTKKQNPLSTKRVNTMLKNIRRLIEYRDGYKKFEKYRMLPTTSKQYMFQ